MFDLQPGLVADFCPQRAHPNADGADVVDLVTEIPLPGRTFCAAPAVDRALPPRVTIGAFIAGPENRLTASAVNGLLEATADDAEVRPALSVLAIHGTTGTGKSHLARGLVRSWQERFGSDSAEFISASDFRHSLADAIKRDAVSEFREQIRNRRLLAIDDLDRLPRDEYVQQELRATLDACDEAAAMIVVTSSSPVTTLRNLAADVRSRLAAGLELRLAPPDEAARERLAQHVSAALGKPLSAEAARRLAAGVSGTAGDVLGALFDLQAELSRPIGSDVRAVERYLASRAANRPTMRAILQTVAKYYRVPQKVLKSSSRRQSAVTARAMAVYLGREFAGLSYERIGEAVGGRDHSTVMHNYRKVAAALATDTVTREAVADLQTQLQRHQHNP
jgi:chromosomal replication initiator protein